MIGMGQALPRASTAGQHLILYDGVCGLCNRLNQFVLPRDPGGLFDFASLQSETGRSIVKRFGRNPDDLDTFYVVTNYRTGSPALLAKAYAGLFVMKMIGPPWSWLGVLRLLPRALLDWGYDLTARYRYRLFGRFDSCLLPRPEHRNRFIDI
jgi:predicted DCC family thiol-disulfide oxidoreductase YuxK